MGSQGKELERRKELIARLKKDTADIVATKVRQFSEHGEIHFPAHYSPENAMKSAWLLLQDLEDKNGGLALEVCTRESVANALLDMVVQGLNPAKKQCYFIAYGNKLSCQRSYFGTMALCKQVTGATDIYAAVVYQGDDFEYSIERGQKVIVKHVQQLANVDKTKIVGAYCVVELPDRNYTDVMTYDQILQAWKQSKMKPVNDKGEVVGKTHSNFTAEMAIRTVINRTCKPLINSSDDSSLVIKTYRRAEDSAVEAEVAEEIEANANIVEIDDADIDAECQAALDAELAEEAAAKPGF